MDQDPFIYIIFLIFISAAAVATISLYARQALLVAYIVVGSVMGPWGLGLVNDANLIRQIGHIGIVFLLFLLGLNLQPRDLLHMAGKITLITLLSSLVFFIAGLAVALIFGFSLTDALWIGGTFTFSSTIIALKLLPTTVLHHQRTGEIIISILLLQDLFAIITLLFLYSSGPEGFTTINVLKLVVALPALIVAAWLITRYLLIYLIRTFDRIQEYIFLLTIAWCLSMAELASALGLSHEIGAFIAGVTLATNPIAIFIAESLKPLRDFFLIMFFFALGAGFNLTMVEYVFWPASALAVIALLLKPAIYSRLFQRTGETQERSHEIGYRLGQMSEFSLLIAVLALQANVISDKASYLIQMSTILTFLISTYIVVLRFPTPIAMSDELRRD